MAPCSREDIEEILYANAGKVPGCDFAPGEEFPISFKTFPPCFPAGKCDGLCRVALFDATASIGDRLVLTGRLW